MDIPAYRKRIESEVAKAAQRPSRFGDLLARSGAATRRRPALLGIQPVDGGDEEAFVEIVDDVDEAARILELREGNTDLRVAAIEEVTSGVTERAALFRLLIERLVDREEDISVRLAALSGLVQLNISAPRSVFDRPMYLDALRSIVNDRDMTLRRRVIGILAREKDAFIQQQLLDGLLGRSASLVPASKAIQLLGYDVHAIPTNLLKEIVEHPPNSAAKREAVRLLAADPTSAGLLSRLLADQTERSDVRRIAAIGLHWLAPAKFATAARRIILDDEEDPDLRATCISALSSEWDGLESALESTDDVTNTIVGLARTASSAPLRRAAKAYLVNPDR